MTWRDILEAFAVMAFILVTYVALPSRYHFVKPDWQEAAVIVTITSVVIIFAASSSQKIIFWISLGISSTIHLVVIHAITQRIPSLSRSEGRGAAVLGFLLFLLVYAVLRLLRRMLCASLKLAYGKSFRR